MLSLHFDIGKGSELYSMIVKKIMPNLVEKFHSLEKHICNRVLQYNHLFHSMHCSACKFSILKINQTAWCSMMYMQNLTIFWKTIHLGTCKICGNVQLKFSAIVLNYLFCIF